MTTLYQAPTESTPEVLLDKQNAKFMIKGRSFPEDASAFYLPVLNWLDVYLSQPNEITEFHVDLDYFNSSTIKQLLNLLMRLELLMKKHKGVKVFWYYEEDDELLELKGKEMQSVVEDLEMVLVKKDS